MQQKTFSTLDRNDGVNVFLSPGLLVVCCTLLPQDFTELLEGWIVLKHAGYLRRMEPFRHFDTSQGLCACPIWLISLTPYVKPYFLPPCVIRNIALL